MRTGLLLESLGIPLAFPIIYPLPALPHPRSAHPPKPSPKRPLFTSSQPSRVAAVPTSYRTFQLPSGESRSRPLDAIILRLLFCIACLVAPMSRGIYRRKMHVDTLLRRVLPFPRSAFYFLPIAYLCLIESHRVSGSDLHES